MEEFTIKGENGFLKILFSKVFGFPDTVGYWGGYDNESTVEINSGSFKVKATMYSSTGEVFDFYEQLLKANELLTGSVHLCNYEHNLDVEVKYDINGQVLVFGKFSEHSKFDNLLKFEFSTDQSYIQSTLKELKSIVENYGGMSGIK
jgi:hypothetical protein